MAGKTFQFRLITPQGKLLDTQVESVQFPGHDGLVGVLPNRAPLVMKLGVGPLRVDVSGASGTKSFFVEDGFAQMVANKLTILTTKASEAEAITEASASAELSTLTAKSPTDRNELARHRVAVQHAKSKVAFAKSRKK
jgi:F-type H+-transporting ATPase subunit epsilon